jgi:hypothetical protein
VVGIPRRSRSYPLWLVAAPVLLAGPDGAWGNAGPSWHEGDPVGEPAPSLASVFIERETLSIDLRPLARGGRALVEAAYLLRNDGEGRTLDLVFLAAALAGSGGAVRLDDRPVPRGVATPPGPLPESWRPPATTPAIGGSTRLDYLVQSSGVIPLTPTLPPGRHLLSVRYEAAPSGQATGAKVSWQLGYILAPARLWAGFGGLDATVRLPSGWEAASDPPLSRRGDRLVGSWDRLPADALALTVRRPSRWALAGLLALGIALLGLALCRRLSFRIGRRLGRHGRSIFWMLPLPVVLGLMLPPTALVPLGLEHDGIGPPWRGNTTGVDFGYGPAVLALLALVVAVPAGLAAVLLVSLRAASRGARQGRIEHASHEGNPGGR